MDEKPLGIPSFPNGCVNCCLVVQLYLESPRLAFHLLANFVVDRNIGDWRFLKVTMFHLVFMQSLWDCLLIGHRFVGVEKRCKSKELAEGTLGNRFRKGLVPSELNDVPLDGMRQC